MGEPLIIVPEATKPVWKSPEKAREFWDGYVDEFVAKWGELGRDIASKIGLYTIREIHESLSDIYKNATVGKIVDILMELYYKGYIKFERVE